MESWQISNKFVDTILDRCKKKLESKYAYAGAVGCLQAELGSIMIELNICFPEAYKKIAARLIEQIVQE